jgi:polyphosphate kinase
LLDSSRIDSNVNPAILKKQLDNPDYYINRELSWIRFNARVLEEARDYWHPLLERVKFLAICGSNLDEFFMTRIPRLLKKINKGSEEKSVDGLTPLDQILASRAEILPLIQSYSDCWYEELVPALTKEDIYIKRFEELSAKEKIDLRELFTKSILPCIIVPPQGCNSLAIENLHVNLFVFDSSMKDSFYILDVPTEKFGRLIEIPESSNSSEVGKVDKIVHNLVFLEDLMENCLDLIFPNQEKLSAYPFRLTRNGEIDIFMDESSDFLNSVKKSLSKRKMGFPSRLEFDKKTPSILRDKLALSLNLSSYLTYEVDGPLGFVDLWQLMKINRPDLKDKSFLPYALPLLASHEKIFDTIAKRDMVLYHPYDGFEVIVDLLKQSAIDPEVTEICITMYRVDSKSPVVEALMVAAKNDKKVVAIIELKAKFDEENNILLASKLQEAGVKIIYNFPKIKVHAKLCQVTRKEKTGIVRYSHIGSGNYNAVTAKIYGDIGYLTARHDVGLELEALFNILVNGLQEKPFKHLLVAPKTLKSEILKRIDREIAFHQQTGNGYLAFKLNNLEETDVIQALYSASMAGVKIDLNIRGLCCLKPGLKGVSDNISVISIVGRFLEHARIFYFHAGEKSDVLIGSSDLMFRNLNERIEVLFSVPDPKVRRAILEDMLKIHLKDNVKARKLHSDGTYRMVVPKEGEEVINSQLWLIQNRGVWHEHSA